MSRFSESVSVIVPRISPSGTSSPVTSRSSVAGTPPLSKAPGSERLLSRAAPAEPRWHHGPREVQSVTLLAANLAELTHELRIEWLTLVEELTAS